MKHSLTGSLRFGQETLAAQQVIGMAKVDPKAPLLMCISTIEVDPHSGTVAIGRIFSGAIERGKTVQLVSSNQKGTFNRFS